MMNRLTFTKKGNENTNARQSRSDRFLAPRSSLADLSMRSYLRDEEHLFKCSDIDNINTPNYLTKKRYRNFLALSLGIHDDKRIYCPVLPVNSAKTKRSTDFPLQHWPCAPRKKQSLASTGSVLDLPSFSTAALTDLLDWGKQDTLVAALGTNYYIWSWKTQSTQERGQTLNEVYACKFEPIYGRTIAFGTQQGIELHDGGSCKRLVTKMCQCVDILGTPIFVSICSITCLDWSPTGNSFATGCSRGVLISWKSNSDRISYRQVKKAALLMISISPNARFIACTSIERDTVELYIWPSLEISHTLTLDWFVKTLNWHPWRSSLLCIGALTPKTYQAVLYFWDAAAKRSSLHTISQSSCCIDAALFNNVTGELVLSVLTKTSYTTSLVVLSDPYTVVDMWDKPECEIDRIRKMMFSPDGLKLATATDDEDLLIWNFLPEHKTYEPRKQHRFSVLPVYIDEAGLGYSLR